MVNEEPKVSDRGKYRIGEAAELLGVCRNTLRKYARSGKVKCGFRKVDGRRYFTGEEIKRIWRMSW